MGATEQLYAPGQAPGPAGYPPIPNAVPPPVAAAAAAPPAYGAPPPGVPPPLGVPPPPPGVPPPPVAGGPMPMMTAPIPGLKMRAPKVPPQPGQVVVGYELCKPRIGPCMCDGLSTAGIIAVIILVLLFWTIPLAWVPCVIPSCFDDFQRPVYDFPPLPPQLADA